ncbi:MAG: hypothetical protein C5S49_08300 [Candidatus Methanogaster sp.]|nr:MAG: hypothetical protein C5S49_08300 [ANME-2 cluster archaeon]
MAITDVPTSFGSSSFIKTFLPGFVASVLYSFAVMPIIASSFWASLTIENKLFFCVILAIVIGMVITSLDLYIYQFFEGIYFWPNLLRRWKCEKIQRYFKKIDDELEKIDDELKDLKDQKREIRAKNEQIKEYKEDLAGLIHKSSKLWAEVRKFPYNPDKGYYSERYPEEATIFGNVLAEYEGYSEKQYGMHMMVFWQHLWFILPNELKEDLDLRGAKADFTVYLSFVFLSYALIGGIGFYLQRTTWVSISTYDIPLGAIICFFISIVLCFLFYYISISIHKSYGRYIKAVFDLYRVDLAEKLKMSINTVNSVPDDAEREKWRKYWKYLLDYKRPDKN